MKKAILIALAALMVISSFTACGNKKANYDDDGYSRVLYNDDEGESSEEENIDEESSEETKSENGDESQESTDSTNSTNSEESKSEKKTSNSDSDKKKSSSSKSSTTSSKQNSSAKVTNGTNSKTTSSKTTSSKVTSSRSTSSSSSSTRSSDTDTSTDTNTDSDSDTDSSIDTDTEWFDSENDSSDTDTSTDVSSDTDSDSIEKGTFEFSDTAFPINGSQITVGQDFETANDLLYGFNTEREIAGGKVYSYNECEITTAVTEEEERITNISITSENYPISKGIRVGATSDELVKAFGEYYLDPENFTYTYRYDNHILSFTVSGDIITGISFS